MENALIVLVYVFAAFLAALQGVVLWKMANNDIDLRWLVADDQGYASLARFQFLIFTFVIVVGFVYLTVAGEGFPKVDEGVLILLGISSASYALGKGLDKQNAKDAPAPTTTTTTPAPTTTTTTTTTPGPTPGTAPSGDVF